MRTFFVDDVILLQGDFGFFNLFQRYRVKPGCFPVFGVQDDEVRFRGKNRCRGYLTAVEAPGSSYPLGKMVLGALCEMNVSAHCPGGLLSGDDQCEFAAAGFGVREQEFEPAVHDEESGMDERQGSEGCTWPSAA